MKGVVAKPVNGSSPHARGLLLKAGSVAQMSGSSPHARGLRRRLGAGHRPAGIIPARAGFTRPARTRPSWPGDHPRTRGVYWDSAWQGVAEVGSSPHARGLLEEDSVLVDWLGSSPHARGLPPAPLAQADGIGIIPARAGFTLRPRRRCLIS